jgi:hypothetical protein
MPIEDSRRDGFRRDGLRIGGWLETLQVRRGLPGRPPLVTPPPPRVPVFHPVPPREAGRRPRALPVFAQVEDPRQVRLRIALTCLVALTVGGSAFAVLADRAGTAPAIAQIAVADPVTMGPMPPLPASTRPSTSPSASASVSASPASSSAPVRQAPAAARHKTSAPAPATSRPAVVGGVRVGGTLTLTTWGRSSSRFVVHAAGGGTVTLESARFPGFYVRAGEFTVRLDRSGGSAFRPVAAGDGTVRLRSAARPDRYLVAFGSRLFLAAVPPSRAAAFATS